MPTTELTAAVNATDVGYGSTVRVTGGLTRTAGAETTGVGNATLTVKVLVAGARSATTVGTGRTLADGSYDLSVPLRVSGALTVSYAGAAGLPADAVDLGGVTAGTWDTAFASASVSRVATTVTVTGALTRTYGGSVYTAAAVPVKVYFTPTSTGVTTQVATATTNAAGTFSARTGYRSAGSYTVKVLNVPGHTDATSSPLPIA
jgi:hypothetical protein